MKSTLTILIIALAMLIALPATAKKPPKPEPPVDPPPVEICDFGNAGVLAVWDGSSPYRCQWTVIDRYHPFTLQIRPASPGAQKILLPYLAVTDIYPYGGDICAAPHESGWHNLPYPADGDEAIWSITLPADGNCADDNNVKDADGPDTFALTISAQKVRNGSVNLVWTNRPTN